MVYDAQQGIKDRFETRRNTFGKIEMGDGTSDSP